MGGELVTLFHRARHFAGLAAWVFLFLYNIALVFAGDLLQPWDSCVWGWRLD